jgi:hypothetical protein
MIRIRAKRATGKGIYVVARDRRTNKSRSTTVEGMTPAQFIRFVQNAIERMEPGDTHEHHECSSG